MSRTFLNRLIIFTFLLFVFSFTSTLVYAQEISGRSESLTSGFAETFDDFLYLENYSDVPKPEGFFFNFLHSKYLAGEFLGIEITQHDSWDRPKQYMMRLDSWGYSNVKINPYFLNGKFIAEGEMAYSPTGIYDSTIGFREYKNQMARFHVRGTWSRFEYGIKYLYVNDGFDKEPVTGLESDKEGVEIWLKRSFGIFSARTFFKDQWNNVDFDRDQNRKKVKEGGIAFEIAIPYWPLLSLSYSRGSSFTTKKHTTGYNMESIQTFGTYVYYERSGWNLSLVSTYSIFEDKTNSDITGSYIWSELSSTIKLDPSIILKPSLGLVKEKYIWPGGGNSSITPSAGMSVKFIPPSEHLEFIAFSEFSPEIDNNGFVKKQGYKGSAQLSWKIGGQEFQSQTLSIEVGYKNSGDIDYGLSAVLAYKIVSFN